MSVGRSGSARNGCPVLFTLLVCVSLNLPHASAGLQRPCYKRNGSLSAAAPQLCFPPIADLAVLPSTVASASSTCQWNETFCYRSGLNARSLAAQNPEIVCSTCANTSSSPENGTAVESAYPAGNALDGNVNTAWKSSPLRAAQTRVEFNMALRRPYVVFGMKLDFPETSVPSLVDVQGSADDGRTWTNLAVLRHNCNTATTLSSQTLGKNASAKAKCYLVNKFSRTVDVEILSESEYSQALQLADSKVAERLASASTFSEMRLLFREIDGIVLDRDTPHRTDLAPFFFYSLSRVRVMGMCQCSGHASACGAAGVAGGDSGSALPACRCQHGTTGRVCGKCAEGSSAVTASPTSSSSSSPATSSAAFTLNKCNASISTVKSLPTPTTQPVTVTSMTNMITTEKATATPASSPATSSATSRAVSPASMPIVYRSSVETAASKSQDAGSALLARTAAAAATTSTKPTVRPQQAATPGPMVTTSRPPIRTDARPATGPAASPAVTGHPVKTLSSSSAVTSPVMPTSSPSSSEKEAAFTHQTVLYVGPAAGVVVIAAVVMLVVQHRRHRKRTRNTFIPTKYADKALSYDGVTFSNFVAPQTYQQRDATLRSAKAEEGAEDGGSTKAVVSNGAPQQQSGPIELPPDRNTHPNDPESLTVANPAAETTLSLSSHSSNECEPADGPAAAAEHARGGSTVNPARALSMVASCNDDESSDPDAERKQVQEAKAKRRLRTKSTSAGQNRRSWAPDNTTTPTYVNLKRIQSAYQHNKAQQAQALQVQLATASLPRSTSPLSAAHFSVASLPRTTSPLFTMGQLGGMFLTSAQPRNCSPLPTINMHMPLALRDSIDTYAPSTVPEDEVSMQGSITTNDLNDELFYACSDLDLNSSLMNCSLASSPLEPELMAALRDHHRRHRRPPSRAHSLNAKSPITLASASESERQRRPRSRMRPKRSKSVHSSASGSGRHYHHHHRAQHHYHHQHQHADQQQRAAALAGGYGVVAHGSKVRRALDRQAAMEMSLGMMSAATTLRYDGGRPTPRPRSRRSYHPPGDSYRPPDRDSYRPPDRDSYRPPDRDAIMCSIGGYPPPADSVIDDVMSIASSLSRRRTVVMEPYSPPREPPATPPELDPNDMPATPEMWSRLRKRRSMHVLEQVPARDEDTVTVIDHGSDAEKDSGSALASRDGPLRRGTMGDGDAYEGRHHRAADARSLSGPLMPVLPSTVLVQSLHGRATKTGSGHSSVFRTTSQPAPLEYRLSHQQDAGNNEDNNNNNNDDGGGHFARDRSNTVVAKGGGGGGGMSGRPTAKLRSRTSGQSSSSRPSGVTAGSRQSSATEFHFDITHENCTVMESELDVNNPESFVIHL